MAKRIVRGALLLALALGTFANAEGQDQETTPAVSTAGEEESALRLVLYCCVQAPKGLSTSKGGESDTK